jgi:hypothetical protein
MLARINDASQEVLRKTWKKFHGEDKDMEYVFELMRILPTPELERLYNACKFSQDGPQITTPMNPKRAKIWKEALRKSVKYQEITKNILKQALAECERC